MTTFLASFGGLLQIQPKNIPVVCFMQILVKTVTRFRMDYCNTTCMQTMLTVCNIYSTYYVIQIVPLSGSYAENNEVRDFKHICNLQIQQELSTKKKMQSGYQYLSKQTIHEQWQECLMVQMNNEHLVILAYKNQFFKNLSFVFNPLQRHNLSLRFSPLTSMQLFTVCIYIHIYSWQRKGQIVSHFVTFLKNAEKYHT